MKTLNLPTMDDLILYKHLADPKCKLFINITPYKKQNLSYKLLQLIIH